MSLLSIQYLAGEPNIFLGGDNAGFKTAGSTASMLDVAKGDIRSFVYKVGDSVSGKKKITVSDLPDMHNCSFSKWYRNEGDALLGHLESFKRLSGAHERIHALASEAVKSANANDGRAHGLYNELTGMAKNIQADIDSVKLEIVGNVQND